MIYVYKIWGGRGRGNKLPQMKGQPEKKKLEKYIKYYKNIERAGTGG